MYMYMYVYMYVCVYVYVYVCVCVYVCIYVYVYVYVYRTCTVRDRKRVPETLQLLSTCYSTHSIDTGPAAYIGVAMAVPVFRSKKVLST